MKARASSYLAAAVGIACAAVSVSYAADDRGAIKSAVDGVITPLMQQHGIPGMAVGIVAKGGPYVFDYGVLSKETPGPVAADTLFEIGSVSKTLTATLASYAQINGNLSLSDDASKYLPVLQGSAFDKVSLLDLGTHTSGGLPLQLPDGVTNDSQLMDYFKDWKPTYAPGTYRLYGNPSIGLLGLIAAKSLNGDFATLMQGHLLPALGLRHTYLEVPAAETKNYAQGYTRKDEPFRVTPRVLAPEAYGVRATADDMVRFVEINMRMLPLDEKLQRAITATQTGYFRIGPMTQDLIWEQYSYPVDLKNLLFGNSDKVGAKPNPAAKIDPPSQPQDNVLINKTGSTNGFATYVAFIPTKKLGIVLLANKNYPNAARVKAAYQILTWLDANYASKN